MRVYNDTFNKAKGAVDLEAAPDAKVRLSVRSEKPVRVFLVSEGEETLFHREECFDLKFHVTGFDGVKLLGTGETPFWFFLDQIERYALEDIDDSKPPAPPEPRATNLVAQIHRAIKEASRRGGPAVLEPDQDHPYFQRYIIEDDDMRFEEDIFAEAQKRASDPEKRPETHSAAEPQAKGSAPPDPEAPQRPSEGVEPPLAAE